MSWQESEGVQDETPSLAGPDGSVLGSLPPRDANALMRAVRDRLRFAIALEEIPGGTRLNQVQVAKQLGVSRMPVRAAVTELVAEGLLEMAPGGGVVVRTLTEQDVRDVYEVRLAIETSAVRHVAQRQPTWGLANIDQIVAEHRPNMMQYDPAKLLEVDRTFHMAILDATDNDYFQRAIRAVWSTVERAMFGSLHIKEVFATAWEEHGKIAEALRAGDPDLAESRLREHLENATAQLTKTLPGSGSAAGGRRQE